MKALITGGAGFVGTNLIQRLLNDGHKVVSVDNYSTGFKHNHVDGCQYFDTDIRTCDDFDFFMEKPDVVFHLAALARIQPSFDEPTETFDTNTVGTQKLLEWARKDNTPVIYAGSSSSHGDKYCNPYTFTKWQGEELMKLYNEVWDLPTTICRFYNVYGPHQLSEGKYCTVVGIFERQYKNGEPLTITWEGEQRRDFTHIDDIVDGLIKCAEGIKYSRENGESTGHITGQLFELGTGNNYSINEVADAFGEDYPREYIDRRPGEMLETLCVDTSAKDVLGWKPKKDLIEFIKKYYVE